MIVSNHGRQLDMGQSAISALKDIVLEFKSKIPIMMDSGIRSGTDIANVLASGAEFTFLGRSFAGVSALGNNGGEQGDAYIDTRVEASHGTNRAVKNTNGPSLVLKK